MDQEELNFVPTWNALQMKMYFFYNQNLFLINCKILAIH